MPTKTHNIQSEEMRQEEHRRSREAWASRFGLVASPKVKGDLFFVSSCIEVIEHRSFCCSKVCNKQKGNDVLNL